VVQGCGWNFNIQVSPSKRTVFNLVDVTDQNEWLAGTAVQAVSQLSMGVMLGGERNRPASALIVSILTFRVRRREDDSSRRCDQSTRNRKGPYSQRMAISLATLRVRE
jgi:hypothetical protein